MIQAESKKNDILQGIGENVKKVTDLLESIQHGKMKVDIRVMGNVHKGLQELKDEVNQVKKMWRSLYLLQRKECQEKLHRLVKTVQLDLQLLNVSVGVSGFEQSEENTKLLRKLADDLRRQGLAQEQTFKQLFEARFGISDELRLVLEQALDKQERSGFDEELIRSLLSAAGIHKRAFNNEDSSGSTKVHPDEVKQPCSTEVPEAYLYLGGASVALSRDGKRAAIGAPWKKGFHGCVRINEYADRLWTQMGSDLDGKASGDFFGERVVLSENGSRVAIGIPYNNGDAGCVRIFDWTGGKWTQVGSNLHGDSSGDWFGYGLAFSADGQRVAIGSPCKDAGHVRIFDWTEGQWTQVGSDLKGETTKDKFGWCLALSSDGSRVVVGAPCHDACAGRVRIFDLTGMRWTHMGSELNGAATEDYLGNSVALSADGTRLAIGATDNRDNGMKAGHVRIYGWTGSQWTQLGCNLEGEVAGDGFGCSVVLSNDGSRVAIGTPYNNGNTGYVRVYDWIGRQWTKVGSDLFGEATGDLFGWSLGLSSDGRRVVIGARGNDHNNGHFCIYDLGAFS